MAKKPRIIPGPSGPPTDAPAQEEGAVATAELSQENPEPEGWAEAMAAEATDGMEVVSTTLPAEADGDPQPVAIAVPRSAIDAHAYLPSKVEARLTIEQRRGLKMLLGGLQKEHARLASGRHVDTPPDAVRWLLEQIQLAPN